MQLLLERDIDQDQILDAFREVEDEPSKMVKRLRSRAQISQRAQAPKRSIACTY